MRGKEGEGGRYGYRQSDIDGRREGGMKGEERNQKEGR